MPTQMTLIHMSAHQGQDSGMRIIKLTLKLAWKCLRPGRLVGLSIRTLPIPPFAKYFISPSNVLEFVKYFCSFNNIAPFTKYFISFQNILYFTKYLISLRKSHPLPNILASTEYFVRKYPTLSQICFPWPNIHYRKYFSFCNI